MTKYQIARFKRAVKRDLTKEVLSSRAKNYRISRVDFPNSQERKLPEYVTHNPWY